MARTGYYNGAMLIFLWDEANVEHIGDHGVQSEEAEYVVRHAKSPYPEKIHAMPMTGDMKRQFKRRS